MRDNRGDFQRVRQPGAVIVAQFAGEDLRLGAQPAIGRTMHDAVAVALKRTAIRMVGLRMLAPALIGAVHGVGGQQNRLARVDIDASGTATNDSRSGIDFNQCVRPSAEIRRGFSQHFPQRVERLRNHANPGQAGMKLVSPCQRGTRCQCKWPGRPAPATRPKFNPMLKPSASISVSIEPVYW